MAKHVQYFINQKNIYNMPLSAISVNKCDRVAGGVKRLLLIDRADIDAITIDSTADTHQVSDIDFAASVYFVEFEFKKGEARVEVSVERQDNGVDVCTVNLFTNIPNPTSAQLSALEDLRGTCEMVAVVQEFGTNTELRIYGFDATEIGTLEFNSLSGGTGAARTDSNTFELNIMGEQSEIPYIVSDANNIAATHSGTEAALRDAIVSYLKTGA